ncbi:WhiB family transcriptional regulator [Streptomyces sp. NPDC048696]|uniref:WhiB family transcriptional regulator n=1 Tax=Streptomyces sp. NPDC048696 TaxID=3365585 RepID=UPI00371D1A9B
MGTIYRCGSRGALGGVRRPHLHPVPSVADRLNAERHELAGAACTQADPEMFFDGTPGAVDMAKQICGSCPVRARCLRLALERGEAFGIFGGLTAEERRDVQRKGVPAA